MNTSRKMAFRLAVAATGAAVSLATLSPAAFAITPVDGIKALSITSGSTLGTEVITITGTNIATGASCVIAAATCPVGITSPIVNFKVDGGADAPATNVRAFSSGVIQATVPAPSTGAAGKATISIDADGAGAGTTLLTSKVGAYSYNAAAPTVTNQTQGVLPLAVPVTSELGGAGLGLVGTGLKDAAVTIGGKKATVTASTATTVTYTAPVGLPAGYQSVVVKTKGGTIDAGVILVTTTMPVITDIQNAAGTASLDQASTLSDTTLTIVGTDLNVVSGVVLHDNATSTPVADQKLTIDKTNSTSIKLVVKLPKSKLDAVTDGDIILSSKYVTTTPNNLSNFSTYKNGAPTLATTMTLAGNGTTLHVTGTNLSNPTAIKYNKAVIAVSSTTVTNATATGFDLTVPAFTFTGSATTASPALEVTTDAGKATGTVAVTAAPSLVSATADLANQKVFLASNGPLTPVALVSASNTVRNQITFTKGNGSITPNSVEVKADGIEVTFGANTFVAGDVLGGTYTQSATEADRFTGTGTGTPKLLGTSAPLTVTAAAAAPTYTAASISSSTVTITGTNLSTANQVTFTPVSGAATVKTGSSDLTVNGGKTTITVTAPATAGTYKVTLKAAVGGANVSAPTPQSVTVATASPATISGVARNATTGVVTISGANLTGSEYITLTPSSGGSATHPSLTGSGSSATFAGPADPDTYTVAVKTSSSGSTITNAGATTFTVAASTLTTPAASSGGNTFTLAGTNLANGAITGAALLQIVFTDVDSNTVLTPTGVVVSGGNLITAMFDAGDIVQGNHITAVYTPSGANALLTAAGVKISAYTNASGGGAVAS